MKNENIILYKMYSKNVCFILILAMLNIMGVEVGVGVGVDVGVGVGVGVVVGVGVGVRVGVGMRVGVGVDYL